MHAMLLKRIVTGLLLAGGSVAIVYWGIWPLTGLCLTIVLFGLMEFYDLALRKGIKPSKATGLFAGVVITVGAPLLSVEQQALVVLALMVTTMIVFTVRKDYHTSSYLDAGVTILGFCYVAWMFSFILHLRKFPGPVEGFSSHMTQGAALAIVLAMGNAMSDVASFFTGKYLGRRKLCPGISPGKTVEGSIGGLVFTLLFVYWLGALYHVPWFHCLIMATLIVAFAMLGDLWESVLKRDVGVKDSGNIVVGHGGMLDRFDSLIFSAPVIYLYVKYILLP